MIEHYQLSKALIDNGGQSLPQWIIMLTALLTLASCDNDDGNKDPSPSIEGIVWVQTRYEYVDCNSGDSNGGASLDCTDQNCQSILFDNGIARYTEVTNSDTSNFNTSYTRGAIASQQVA
jgi:hypothetical protein